MARPFVAILIVATLVTTAGSGPAAAVEPFDTSIVSVNQSGDIIYAANTLLTCSGTTGICGDAKNNPGGTAQANNSFTMIDVDVDGDASTFNSSSAAFTLPAGASVTWAGLFWGAVSSSSARNTVEFQTPGSGTYQTVTAPGANIYTSGSTYQAYADVTGLVQAGGSGLYTTANVSRTAGGGRHAGWTLIVVTDDPNEPFRNLSVFDGFQRVNSGNPVDITVSGFLSPPVGPVNAEIGFVAYEGDDRYTGDYVQLNGTRLGDALTPTTNFFNSRITDGGVYASGGNPSYFDQLGFDAKVIETVGIVPPGATSAVVQLRSAGDWYYPGVVTTAIDIFVPNLVLDLDKTVSDDDGGNVNVGDTLTYTIAFSNQGEDAALETVLRDAIPAGTTYVAGSAEIVDGENIGTANAVYDAGADEVLFFLGDGASAGTGGRIAPFATTGTEYEVQFQVTVDPGTEDTDIDNVGTLEYVAETIGDSFASDTPLRRVTVEPLADLSLVEKTDTVDPVFAGDTTTYSIDVANAGPSPAENTQVIDTLPAGFTFASGAGCSAAGQVVTCDLGTIPNGGTATATFTVDVDGDAPARVETNNAQVVSTTPDDLPLDNFGSETTTVQRLVDLATTKSASPDPTLAGNQITYTLTATNNGPSDAQNTSLSDSLPSGVGFVSATLAPASTGSCGEAAGTVTCTWPELASGVTETVTIVVDVPPSTDDATLLTNKAEITSGDPEDPAGDPNTAEATTPIEREADLSVTKTADGPFIAGTTVPFTVSVTNDGPSNATNVVVVDTPPAGTTFVPASSSSTCVLDGGDIRCDLASLDAGATADFVVALAIPASMASGTDLSNSVTVAADETDPQPANDDDALVFEITRSADISIVKKASPDVVVAGSPITYTLDIANAGPSDATSVSVTDVLPAGVTLASSPGCTGTTTLTCPVGTLASGATASFTIVVDVPAGTGQGVALENTATVNAAEPDPSTANNTSVVSTNVTRTTALEVTKTESSGIADPALAGTPISWDIVVTNTGPSDDANVTITDDLSALPISGVTATITNEPTNACTITPGASDPGTLACSVPTLNDGDAVTITVAGTLDADIADGTTLVNTASAESPTSPAATGEEETTIQRSADLGLTKTGPATIFAGDTGTWTVTVTNAGPGQADDVVLTDILPADATYVTHRIITGNATCSTLTGPLVCETAALGVAPNNVIRIEVDATIADTASHNSISTNKATVETSTTDPNPANDEREFDSTVLRSADLQLSKATLDTPIAAGETSRFSLTVTNAGPSIATNVVVTDTLPPGFTFVPAASDANCTLVGSDVECTASTIDPDDPPVSFVVTLLSDGGLAAGTQTNEAVVAADEDDPDAGTGSTNNTASSDVEITRRADLGITKSPADTIAIPGESFSWTLAVTNLGPSTAVDSIVTDTLPPGVAFDAAASDSRCVVTAGTPATGQTITCTLGDLPAAPATTVDLDIVVDIDAATGAGETNPTLDNAAGVASTTEDPSPGDDEAVASTPLVGQADLSSTKTGTTDVVAGETITWTVTVANDGPSLAAATVLTDTLPAGVTFDPATSDFRCSVDSGDPSTGQTIVCNLGNLDPAISTDVSLSGTVDPSALDGSTITNNASVSSTTNDTDGSNDASSADTAVTRVASLSAAKSVAPTAVAAGGTVVYQLSLTNAGPSTASLATLADALPASLTIDSYSLSTPGSCLDSITCRVTELAPGDSLAVSVTATVSSSTPDPTTITNTVTASAPEDPTNTSASAAVTVTRSADLTVEKTVSPTTLRAGERATFTVNVENLGPSDATAVQVIDPIPTGLTFVDASSDTRCDQVGSDVVCTFASLVAGTAPVSLDLVFDVGTDADAGLIENRATASATENDPVAGNDTGLAELNVITSADLSITKSSSSDPVVPGSPYAWTLSYSNAGPSDARATVITDVLPAGVTFDPATSDARCVVTAGTPATGQTVTCTIGDLAPSSTAQTLAIGVDVDPSITPASITNAASITSTTADPNTDDNDADDTSTVAPAADLSVIKVGPATITAGTDLTWTITAGNAGPSDAVTPTVVDVLPVGVTFDAATSDARCAVSAPPDPTSVPPIGQTITCTLATMGPAPAASSTESIVIGGSLDNAAADGSELVNEASISSITDDPESGNDSDDSRTDVDRIADLTITKVADAAIIVAGENVTYTIVATNDGPSIATDVAILDSLAPGLTLVSATPSAGSCDTTAGIVNCSLAQLDPGDTFEVDVEATVDPDVAGTTEIDNAASATAAENDPDGADATETITVDTSADLNVAKTLLTADPVAGEPATFEIVITNDGPSDATNVELVDSLPPGLTFQPTGSTSTCAASVAGATCTMAVIAAGSAETITIVADISSDVDDSVTLVNTVDVAADQDDPDTDDNQDTADVSIERRADLSLDKVPSPVAPTPGSSTSWTIDVVNEGPSDASDVTITDTLPVGATFDAATSDLRCTVTAGPDPSPSPTFGETVTCVLGGLIDGSTDSFVIGVDLDPTLIGDIANTASVDAAETDPDPDDNTETVTTTVIPSADLSVVKVRLTDPIVAGQDVTYELTVTNAGPSTAVATSVSDTFPTVLAYLDASSDARCDLVGSSIGCVLGDLAPGDVETMQLTFSLDDDAVAGSDLTNTATVTSDTDDPNEGGPTSDNTSSETGPITRSADLSIDKTGPATLTAGGTGSYAITVVNDGPSVASGVTISDAVPAGLTITAFTGPSTCSITASALSCSIARMEPGDRIDITLDVAVGANTADAITLTNNASVSANEPDPTPGNNGSSVDAVVERSADLALTKSILTDPIVAGEPMLFELTVTNDGPSDASNIIVSDVLPAGLDYRDNLSSTPCSATPSGPGQTVSCSISTLPVGGSISFLVGVDTDATLNEGATISNTASVDADEVDPDGDDNTATANGIVTRETDLSVIKRGPAGASTAGTTLRWTLDISNEGASEATTVVVSDTLPAGATFQPATSDSRCVLAGASTIECSIAVLASGDTDQFVIDVDLSSGLSDGSLLANTADITGTENDPNPGNNTSGHVADIDRTSGLGLTKVDVLDPVVAGETIAWDMTVINIGPSDTDDVLITDTLPVGITFDAAASDGRCSVASGTPGTGQVIECPIGTLVVTESDTVRITGSVDQGIADGAQLINQATATGTSATPVSTEEETTINRSAEVTVTKVADTSPIIPGVPVTYTVTVSNEGPSQATDVELTDLVPPGGSVTAVRVLGSPGLTCTTGASTVSCPIGTMDSGTTVVVEIDVTPAPFLQSGDTFENKVMVTGNEDPTPGEGSSVEPLARSVDLSIEKTAASTVVAAGDGVTFELVVSNDGPSDAANVTITDTLPALMTFDPATSSPSCTSVAVDEVRCAVALLEAGESITFTLGVQIDATATADLTNQVSVASDEINRNPSPTDDEQITLSEVADLTVAKAGPSSVVAGETISYEITVENAGPSVARNVVVTDELPQGVAFATPDGCTIADSTMTCAIGDLAVGGSGLLIVTGTVDPGFDGVLRNVATGSSDAADPNTADNTGTSQADTERIADLQIDKTLETADLRSGGDAAWAITVTNDGPSTATDVSVTDTLPTGLTLTSASPSTCEGERTLTCDLPDLAVGESMVITLDTAIATSLVGPIENTATVDSAEADPTEAAATASGTVDRSSADLAITKTGASTSLNSGSTVVWTVTVSNTGPDDIITPITVDDTLPGVLGYATHTAPDGTACAIDGQEFSCTIDALANGATVDITITTTVRVAVTEVTNTASAAAAGLAGGDGSDGQVRVASTAVARAPISRIAFTGASTAGLLFIAAPLLIMGFLALQFSRRNGTAASES